MDWISTAFSAIGEFKGIYTSLSEKSRTRNIHKKLIVRELRDNLKRYEQVFKNKLSIDSLIDDVSNTEIKNAIQANFDFNKLKKGKITKQFIEEPRNLKYNTWTSAMLMDKIDEKTEELKNLKALNNGTVTGLSTTNVNLMLSNQFYRMKLMARFIND